MKSLAELLIKDIQESSSATQAEKTLRFFKTGKGQYAQHDIFWGISVPNIRAITQRYISQISLEDTQTLLKHFAHEVRFAALVILIHRYQNTPSERDEIVDIYIKNTAYINNWDLVDLSAAKILGAHCYNGDSKEIVRLCKSDDLWEARIAIVSTHYFILRDSFCLTFDTCKKLLDHPHDLMHKACGWMLREIGKRNTQSLTDWLDIHYHLMPRTMLRYSIERFPKPLRLAYLQGKI